MALVGRLKYEHSLLEHLLQVHELSFQFKYSFLKLNTTKSKELIFRVGGTTPSPKPIFIDNQEV